MGQYFSFNFIYYNFDFNYAFNIRLNIEAQSSKYLPEGLSSKYWAGLTLAMVCSYL